MIQDCYAGRAGTGYPTDPTFATDCADLYGLGCNCEATR